MKHSGAGLLAVLLAVSTAQGAALTDEVRAYRLAHERQIVTDFMALLALPNVATSVTDVDKNAAYLESQLQARGFSTRLLRAQAGTPPSVFAEIKVPGARRTVVFYAHYDGQPVAQKGWITEPFTPEMRTALPDSQPVNWQAQAGALDESWRIFARSSGDDKGSIQAMP